MTVALRHVLEQGPMLRALGRAAVSTAVSMFRSSRPRGDAPSVPGPWIEGEIAPSAALVAAYVRHVGGDPSAYRKEVPAHLFPQWGLPLAARATSGLSYPIARVLNAGCRLEIRAPLPLGEPLLVRARLESVDDDGQRAILTQRVVTGPRSMPDAVVADVRAFVPLQAERDKRRAPVLVPTESREIAFGRVGAGAGLDFAKLTGDFNPVHWVPAYARGAGFRSCILHGFATLARAVEALHRRAFSNDVHALTGIDVRFTRPLLLPRTVGVYIAGGDVFVGDGPGGMAYLAGSFTAKLRGGSSS